MSQHSHTMNHINVTLAYAPSRSEQHIEVVVVPAHATATMVLQHSKLIAQCPEIIDMPLGVFGRKITPDTPLEHEQRLEVYRPLTYDPMQKRKRRSAKK